MRPRTNRREGRRVNLERVALPHTRQRAAPLKRARAKARRREERRGAERSYAQFARELGESMLTLQRPDGEFMHQIHLDGAPVNIQLPHFSGETALALARLHALTGDPRYLGGAKRSVAYLVGGLDFFERYYITEPYWTCQAVGELWDRAPNRVALDHCLSIGRDRDFDAAIEAVHVVVGRAHHHVAWGDTHRT